MTLKESNRIRKLEEDISILKKYIHEKKKKLLSFSSSISMNELKIEQKKEEIQKLLEVK